MDFSLPEKILQLKEEAREWVENVLNPLSVPLEEEERVPEELVEELRNGHFRFFWSHHPQGIWRRGMDCHRMVHCPRGVGKGICHG